MDIILQPRSGAMLVVGTMTRPLLVREPAPSVFVGVRFLPGVLAPALRTEAVRLVDRTVDAGSLPADSEAWLDAAADLGADTRRTARNRDLWELVRSFLEPARPDDVVLQVAAAGRESAGRARVADLACQAGVSIRTLERRYRTAVGTGPKFALQVERVRAARALLGQGAAGLSSVAHYCGYTDQAHFTREFKRISGITPGDWRRVASRP